MLKFEIDDLLIPYLILMLRADCGPLPLSQQNRQITEGKVKTALFLKGDGLSRFLASDFSSNNFLLTTVSHFERFFHI
jgi:hypothetical protein